MIKCCYGTAGNKTLKNGEKLPLPSLVSVAVAAVATVVMPLSRAYGSLFLFVEQRIALLFLFAYFKLNNCNRLLCGISERVNRNAPQAI